MVSVIAHDTPTYPQQQNLFPPSVRRGFAFYLRRLIPNTPPNPPPAVGTPGTRKNPGAQSAFSRSENSERGVRLPTEIDAQYPAQPTSGRRDDRPRSSAYLRRLIPRTPPNPPPARDRIISVSERESRAKPRCTHMPMETSITA